MTTSRAGAANMNQPGTNDRDLYWAKHRAGAGPLCIEWEAVAFGLQIGGVSNLLAPGATGQQTDLLDQAGAPGLGRTPARPRCERGSRATRDIHWNHQSPSWTRATEVPITEHFGGVEPPCVNDLPKVQARPGCAAHPPHQGGLRNLLGPRQEQVTKLRWLPL
jgi:hypothetical protein